MDTTEVAGYAVPMIAGMLSGVVGSIVGAYSQRYQYNRQAKRDRHLLLWTYERVLREMSERLMEEHLTGSSRPGSDYPDVQGAWASAYAYLAHLPEDLRRDLADPFPDVQTSYEAGDHLGWLANRLRDRLLSESSRPGRTVSEFAQLIAAYARRTT